MILIDSDVMIWFLHNNLAARKTLQALSTFCLSVVTDMEVMQGTRDKDEMRRWRRWLDVRNIETLQIDTGISQKAALLVQQLTHSHHLQSADALIAATALQHGLPLLTANQKHFRAVPGLEVQRFRPS